MIYLHNSRIFLLQLVMKVSLCSESEGLFPLIPIERASEELSVRPTMCCLWYLLPLK